MRHHLTPFVLATLLATAGCAQRTCANYSVLDKLDSVDAERDLAHVGLVRGSATTRIGPAGNKLQCSVWEKLHVPGKPGVVLRPQYYSARYDNNAWVLTP